MRSRCAQNRDARNCRHRSSNKARFRDINEDPALDLIVSNLKLRAEGELCFVRTAHPGRDGGGGGGGGAQMILGTVYLQCAK
jgi:hypothetical protein